MNLQMFAEEPASGSPAEPQAPQEPSEPVPQPEQKPKEQNNQSKEQNHFDELKELKKEIARLKADAARNALRDTTIEFNSRPREGGNAS